MNAPPDTLSLLLRVSQDLHRKLSPADCARITDSHPHFREFAGTGKKLKEFLVRFTDSDAAVVRGSMLRKRWKLECSCAENYPCWHLLAACICVLIDREQKLPLALPRIVSLYRLEGRVAHEAEAKPAVPPAAADSVKGPALSRSSPSLSSLVSAVEKKLGRAVAETERSFLQEIQTFYQKHARSKNLSADALRPFCAGHRLPIWELFQVWPTPPEDAWQAWLYLACFLQARSIPIPDFLQSITSATELQKLAGGWAQNEMLSAWEDTLQRLLAEVDSEEEAAATWDLRLVLGPEGARLQSRSAETEPWVYAEEKKFEAWLAGFAEHRVPCTEAAATLAGLFLDAGTSRNELPYQREDTREKIARLLLNSAQSNWVCTATGDPVEISGERLAWRLEPVRQEDGSVLQYQLVLSTPEGSPAPTPWFFVGGRINCYVSGGVLHRTAPLLRLNPAQPFVVPVPGLRSEKCIQLFHALEVALPEEIASRVVRVRPEVQIRAWLSPEGLGEKLHVQATAKTAASQRVFTDAGWELREQGPMDPQVIVTTENRILQIVSNRLADLALQSFSRMDDCWHRVVGKRFPEEFCTWVKSISEHAELILDPDLDSLRSAQVAGSLRLEIEEGSPDWFDVRVALAVTDTELTPEEIQLLMQAKGEYVRLSGKGWRRLEFELGEEEASMLEELGINPFDLDSTPQKFHTVQLIRSRAQALLGSDDLSQLKRRAEDLKLDWQPAVPAAINATLRPYQIEGFHFLVYLSANRFGGILADDMGLGKTLQTLTWIQWLREQPDHTGKPVLVVCPKSVVQNWISEAQRFLPGVRARVWNGGDSASLRECIADSDVVVVNYTQLRLSAQALGSPAWHAVILDEAQYIKNPASQTAVAACALRGTYRLALSGTPIENRLMDLWSILQFSMPGLLGVRAQFQKRYDSRTDVFARRRLSARVRPFVLRRTKAEVASDLPARIEEDLVVEMEGTQALLYSAELKRARQELLKIRTSKDFDKQRFHVLTSLLRLRQICCHPGLVSDEHGHADSAKLDALVDLLEPLMEEGHKVLVFSQFVEMLERIEREIEARSWSSFLLTGETENRGELVDAFQSHEGSAVFLISLRAGGMGLNLTAASYVILYDPWWNPAVENQAIDRTHRIGQTQQVIAYRLIARNSVEQKIRQLQQSKCALAGDILGEESLAKALSMEDFRFLMED